jgi:DNA-binding MarR family transcriptional regulator
MQLCVALQRAARAIVASYRPLLAEIGLTYSQYAVLLVLWERDPAPMRLIAERLDLDSATLSPLLKRLESRGLLVRQRRADDERTVDVALTPAGRDLRAAAEAVQERVQRATGLTDEALVGMRDDLNALTARLHGAALQGAAL